jgi:hypothetical protein
MEAVPLGCQARELRLLRWEQRAGWLQVAPLRRRPLARRGLPVETWGRWPEPTRFRPARWPSRVGCRSLAAASLVTFTTAAPRNKNRHMCWYGTSGAGKGYSLRVLLSRERFANGLRVYGIDQDEQQEYAGRFCDYLLGTRVHIRTVLDAAEFDFGQAVVGATSVELRPRIRATRNAIEPTSGAHTVVQRGREVQARGALTSRTGGAGTARTSSAGCSSRHVA